MDQITICIPTFRRNASLTRLLRGIARQETANHFSYSVVVVDNDAAGAARQTVSDLSHELGLDIAYDIEVQRLIPAVRNRALRLARGNFIGIIDDDEFPPPLWLLSLYQAIKTFDVDGALGPVLPFFEQPPPVWLVRSKLCELPVHRTGTILHWRQGYTGNVLLKREVFEAKGLYFDERFRTGGSDQDFFRRAIAAGYRFVAVEAAAVFEVVPPQRWRLQYWFKRAFVNGYNSRQYVVCNQLPAQIAVLFTSLAAVLIYSLCVPCSVFLGRHVLISCLTKNAYHFSRLCAFLGVQLWKKRDF